jgi:UDP-N-acetylmuramate--alanine ligase
MDDYGHHPTEIAATLQTARECWPEKRLIVVFQPHRFSRTKMLYERFVISFNHADMLILAPLYSADPDRRSIREFTGESKAGTGGGHLPGSE